MCAAAAAAAASATKHNPNTSGTIFQHRLLSLDVRLLAGPRKQILSHEPIGPGRGLEGSASLADSWLLPISPFFEALASVPLLRTTHVLPPVREPYLSTSASKELLKYMMMQYLSR